MWRIPRLLAALVFLLPALPADAQPFGRALTSQEVACEERQLIRLVHRMAEEGSGIETPNLFVWRAAPEGGAYRGVAVTGEIGGQAGHGVRGPEQQVAFDLLFKTSEDFLSPRRPLLPQATLVRRDTASFLRAADQPRPFLAVSFDVAPTVPNPILPEQPIRITSRRAVGEGQSDRPGRGLAIDDLLSVCHHEVTPFDLRVFSILARTVRASECLAQHFPDCIFLFGHKSVIFRGEEPLSYRMNVFSYSGFCDDDGCGYGEADVALLFHLQVDRAGRITIGDVQALPFCEGGPIEDQIGCTQSQNPHLGIYVLPPIRPGVERQGDPEFQRAAFLNVDDIVSEFNILQADVNWDDLLRDTSWNQGFEWTTAPVNVCTVEP